MYKKEEMEEKRNSTAERMINGEWEGKQKHTKKTLNKDGRQKKKKRGEVMPGGFRVRKKGSEGKYNVEQRRWKRRERQRRCKVIVRRSNGQSEVRRITVNKKTIRRINEGKKICRKEIKENSLKKKWNGTEKENV